MTEARELTRVCGFSIVATVQMYGLQVFDDFGRDVAPVSFVGKAIGRIENGNAVVDWKPILTVKTPKMIVGGETGEALVWRLVFGQRSRLGRGWSLVV